MAGETKKYVKDYEKLKIGIRQGKTLKSAMLDAGWPESLARQGRAGIGAVGLRRLLRDKVDIGRSISPEEQEQLVRGGLIQNALTGKDSAVQSYKLLGQDRRVNMFTPDNQVGIIVLGELPKTMEVLANELPPIKGELPDETS